MHAAPLCREQPVRYIQRALKERLILLDPDSDVNRDSAIDLPARQGGSPEVVVERA